MSDKIIIEATYEGSLEAIGLQGLVFKPYRAEFPAGRIEDGGAGEVSASVHKAIVALLGVRAGSRDFVRVTIERRPG